MQNKQDVQNAFFIFKQQYGVILNNFLNSETSSEKYLNEGYKLGRQAIDKKMSILNLAAIHQDCLISYLEKLETNEHIIISEKANAFFEEILSSFQMMATPFREAITLLNQRSLEYANRIRKLQGALKEKEALLKEVYHRVKNNLQVVSSLLNLQAEATQELEIKKVLIGSSARIKSMALIHEMLYQTENLSNIDMEGYIHSLLNYLFQIYAVNPNRIKLTTDIDNISFNIDTAIPCGLIINELVSNALKHAFPGDKSGEIQLLFKRKDKKIVLQISDDGDGVPPQIDIKNTISLGMRLLHNLTKQLGGSLLLDSAKGTTFKIMLPIDNK